MLRKMASKALQIMGLHSLYRLKNEGSLVSTGWLRSMKERAPVDFEGNPVPWITYPAISFLQNRIRPDMSVFEYGSGNSTLWWASKVTKVVACEHDPAWFERVKAVIPSNVELSFVDLEYDGEYCRKITEFKDTFDIVIIDGRDRERCAKNCLPALKGSGVIVWDNTDREAYARGQAFLRSKGYRQIDFDGMTPLVTFTSRTSIFYRDSNCLGI